jgi:hypothetical protein
LDKTHERVVDGRVTVGVKFSHHVTDNTRTLRECFIRTVAAVVHRIEHPAMDRFQAIANVGQRTPDNHTHGVVEITALHLDLNVDLIYPITANGGVV